MGGKYTKTNKNKQKHTFRNRSPGLLHIGLAEKGSLSSAK
jgi:hypothetical protein